MANVIELLLRAKDEASPQINKFRSTVLGLKTAIAGLAAGITFKAIIDNMIEAERATSKLDLAFKNTGQGLGITRKGLDDLAASMQNTTTYSDDLVKEAEALLLSFDKVRGQAFERTIKVGADLAAHMGTDLPEAIKSLGFALNAPVDGLQRLRRAGIQMDDSQQALIKSFAEAGQLEKAQSVILSELERKYGGAADAARNTLGGALTGLKNAFGDLFEGTKEGSQGAVDAINSLAQTLSSPEVKTVIDGFIAGLAKVVELTAQTAVGLKILFTGKGGNALLDAQTEVEALQENIDRLQLQYSKGLEKGKSQSWLNEVVVAIDKTSEQLIAATERLNQARAAVVKSQNPIGSGTSKQTYLPVVKEGRRELNPQLRLDLEENMKWLEEYKRQNDSLRDTTRTSTQEMVDDYNKAMDDIKLALDRGLITEKQAAEKRNEVLENTFKEIDLSGYKKRVIETNDEITSLMRGAWEEVGRSIQSTLSDALYSGEFSMRKFGEVIRRALADITAAIVTSGIKKALGDQFAGSGEGGSGGGIPWGSIIKTIGSLFTGGGGKSYGGTGYGSGPAPSSSGYAAAGGRQSGWTWVGEEGPELANFGAGGNVYNARQLAFGGGMGGINYSPTYTFNASGDSSIDEKLAQLSYAMQVKSEQDKQELIRQLRRNGVSLR